MVLAALGAVAFSGKAIIVKLGYRYGVDAITLLALRMFFALPFFLAVALWMRYRGDGAALSRSDMLKIVGLGFCGYYLASYLDFLGLSYVSPTLERLILYLNPTIVLLINVFIFGRTAHLRQVIALVVSYLGVAIALGADWHGGGSHIVLGSILVLASAVSYALYLVGSGELVKRIGSVRLTSYASCVACAFCLLQFLIERPLGSLELPAGVYWLSILNGSLCTVLPVFAVMFAIARIGATSAAQVGLLGPVATIALSTLILGEHLGVAQILGTVLVMGGVLLVSQRIPKGD